MASITGYTQTKTDELLGAKADASDLGGAALMDVGIAAGTVMAGDDSRVTSLPSTYAPLPTGTPDGTKYLRDDNTWQAVSGGFDLAQNVTLESSGTDPVYIDTLGDGYLYGRTSSRLYRTTSETGPWTLVHDFSTGDAVTGIKPVGGGEVLVARSNDGLWKSSGWATNPLTATFAQVLVTDSAVKQFGWTTDPASGWAFATTYVDRDGVLMSNSRYAWLSQDDGDTWAVVFDMQAEHPALDARYSHMHVATIDPLWDAVTPRLWITYHKTISDPTNGADPLKRIMWSDDAGATWSILAPANTYQPVIGIPTAQGMVFGSDENVVALYVVPRTTVPADMTISLLYRLRRDGIAGMFGWATKAIPSATLPGAAHVAFRTNNSGQGGSVITTDGRHAQEVLRLSAATGTDTVDIVDIVEYEGRVLGTYYQTDSAPGVGQRIRMDVPLRGAPPEGDGGLDGGTAGSMGVAAGGGSTAGNESTALGASAVAGLRSVAVGSEASANVQEGTAVGCEATTTGATGTAIGRSAAAETGVSVGRNAVSTGDGTSFGNTAESVAEATAVGSFANATAAQSTAVGRLATATGQYTTAVGALSGASATGSTALGRNSKATHEFSVAIGYASQTSAANQAQIGTRHVEIGKVTAPAAPAAGKARLFLRDNGSGKMQLAVQFPSGAVQVLATEP